MNPQVEQMASNADKFNQMLANIDKQIVIAVVSIFAAAFGQFILVRFWRWLRTPRPPKPVSKRAEMILKLLDGSYHLWNNVEHKNKLECGALNIWTWADKTATVYIDDYMINDLLEKHELKQITNKVREMKDWLDYLVESNKQSEADDKLYRLASASEKSAVVKTGRQPGKSTSAAVDPSQQKSVGSWKFSPVGVPAKKDENGKICNCDLCTGERAELVADEDVVLL